MQPPALAYNQQITFETVISASLGYFHCKIKSTNCPETKHYKEHVGNKIENRSRVLAKNC